MWCSHSLVLVIRGMVLACSGPTQAATVADAPHTSTNQNTCW